MLLVLTDGCAVVIISVRVIVVVGVCVIMSVVVGRVVSVCCVIVVVV